MEDQQPTAGDLTDPVDEGDGAPAETDDTATDLEAQPDVDGESEAPSTRRAPGKWLVGVVAVAVALFVGAAGFAGATLKPYLSDRATAATKLKVAQTAARAITTLFTYKPEDMDTLGDRAATYLSGDFEAQYRKFIDEIVAPNKQTKTSSNTEVTGVAVESLDVPNAVALVYTNATSTSPLTKNIPSRRYYSYRLIMKRNNGRWLVTRMTTVTWFSVKPEQ